MFQDFEAYAQEIEDSMESARTKLTEETMLLTNNQLALKEEENQLKFEKSDLVRFNKIFSSE